MLVQPSLNLLFLSGKYDALPFHYSGALAVFGHDVRAFIENFDKAIRLCPFKAERRKRTLVFLHVLLSIAETPYFVQIPPSPPGAVQNALYWKCYRKSYRAHLVCFLTFVWLADSRLVT